MVDRERAAKAIEEFLRALGHEPEGELEGTGARVAQAWADDLLAGEGVDIEALLRDGSIPAAPHERGLVLVRGVRVTTMCPHHLLPGHGAGLVAYLPGERVAGIGALARLLDACARRLVLQEQIGGQVAELLVRVLGARGALCRLELVHTCLVARGERETSAVVETVALAGTFAEPSADRDLALTALRGGVRAG